MKAWELTQSQLESAAWRASRRIGPTTQLVLRDVNEHGVRVKNISFLLRFESPTKRLLKRERIKLDPSIEAEYPPGVMIRPHYYSKRVLDAIPASEVFSAPLYRTETVCKPRSCNAPCWHTFGHFLRCCFEINPQARIKTGLADYRGMEGFESEYRSTNVEKGSPMNPLRYDEACECHLYGITRF